MRMDLNNQSVRPGRYCRSGHRLHHLPAPRPMTGIDDNREMRQLLDRRYRREIQRITGKRLIGTDAALTENNLLVTGIHDIFGGVQPFRDGGR